MLPPRPARSPTRLPRRSRRLSPRAIRTCRRAHPHRGARTCHRAAAAVARQAVLKSIAKRDVVVRCLGDRDRVVLAECQVDVDELSAGALEPLPARRDTLVPVLDRLDALLGEADERDVTGHVCFLASPANARGVYSPVG